MIQKCEQCGLEYDAKRKSSKFCSSKCRKLAFQDSVPEVSVPVFDENANLIATVEHNGEIVARTSSNGSDATVVILSDCQEFTPDVTLQPEIDRLYRGGGTVYQQQLATLSLQYDIIRGSDKAKEHAKRVMEGGAWC